MERPVDRGASAVVKRLCRALQERNRIPRSVEMNRPLPNDPVSPEVVAIRKRKKEQLRGQYDLPQGAYFLDNDAHYSQTAFFGTTANTPHEIVEFDGSAFFIARLPEGDSVVHGWNPADCNGYGGAEVDFLLKNGTVKTVLGPYQMSPDFRDLIALADHVRRPQLLWRARKIAIGRIVGEGLNTKLVDIIYEEDVRTVSPIVPRIFEEWSGLDIRVDTRNGGCSYSSVDDFLKWEIMQPP